MSVVQSGIHCCPSVRAITLSLACLTLLATPQRGICQIKTDGERPARITDPFELKYRDVQRAILVFKQGHHDEARKILADAKSKHAEMPPIDVMMARLFFAAGEVRKAEDALERSIVESSEDPEGYLLLGDFALRGKRPAFAELAYQRALSNLEHYDANSDRKHNLRIRAIAGLASLAENRGQFAQAESFLNSWTELDPTSPHAWGSLGRVKFRLKEYDAARAAFRRLSEVESKSPPVEIAMGRLYSEAAMHEQAYHEMTSAVQHNPDDSRVLLTVAEWALHNGLLDLAETNVTHALAVDSQSLEAQVLSARLSRYRDDYETAESVLSKLLPVQPNSVVLIDEYARTLATSENDQKRKAALIHAERNYRALRKRKSSMMLQSIVTYAWTLHHNGESQKAQAIVQSLPNGSSISNENGFYVASICADREETEVAIAMLKSLLVDSRPFPLRHKAERLLETLSNG